VHVREHQNVLKRLFVRAGAFNLGLWMRTLFGVGTPRSLQGRGVALGAMVMALWALVDDAIAAIWSAASRSHAIGLSIARTPRHRIGRMKIATCTTGC